MLVLLLVLVSSESVGEKENPVSIPVTTTFSFEGYGTAVVIEPAE